MAYRIVIDRLKCESNGYCMRVAPHLIQPALDGNPLLVFDTIDAEHHRVALLAVESCPMNALRIEQIASAS
jgi:ferredoxin